MKKNGIKMRNMTVNSNGELPVNINNDLDEGCCSVILQVTSNHHVVAFRRDATFPADLIITQNSFYGKNAEIQYKVNGGLFYHTVITSDGWIVGSGGIGSNYNHELMSLAGQIMEKGVINPDYVQKAQSILTRMGVGHFLIKSPDNNVGFVIHFTGTTLNKLFKMKDGEFISVPNAPQYYREGKYPAFNSNPIRAAAMIEGTDLWGINRRDVIIHDVQKNANSTMLQIWASFDNGSLINRNDGKGGPDDIQFLDDQIIYGKDLPIIPNMIQIGRMNLVNEEDMDKKNIKYLSEELCHNYEDICDLEKDFKEYMAGKSSESAFK
ncbi:hypothetical protein [Methanobacterium sp.]|uniref:hypothetical protein n=1 Tax=Methanobacterium sp. TaxID=2164 RepID=UPI003C76D202